MLSRIAESLFWIGRYIERADGTARIVDVLRLQLLEDPAAQEGEAAHTVLSVIMGMPSDGAVGFTDVGDRLKEVDPTPEAQAAVMLLKRLRYEAQFKRGSAKPAKTLVVPKQRSFASRVVGKLRRMKNEMFHPA